MIATTLSRRKPTEVAKAHRRVPSGRVNKDPDRDREGVSKAIRLVPETRTNGQGGITLEAINEPAPADAEAQAQGVRVVVAQELAPKLDDAVLGAKPTEQVTEFFIRSPAGLKRAECAPPWSAGPRRYAGAERR
jgi:hypothetical protein